MSCEEVQNLVYLIFIILMSMLPFEHLKHLTLKVKKELCFGNYKNFKD